MNATQVQVQPTDILFDVIFTAMQGKASKEYLRTCDGWFVKI